MITDTQQSDKSHSRVHSHRMGKYYSLVTENNRHIAHILTLGPQFAYFFVFFAIVNLISVYLLLKLNSTEQARLYYYVYMVIFIYLDITWLLCALINPGIAYPEGSIQPQQSCEQCHIRYNVFISRIEGRYHCRRCAICIDGFKYHCYLSGNCVGKNNFILSYFLILAIMLWIIDLTATLPFVYYL